MSASSSLPLHPLLDGGLPTDSPSFAGGVLSCHCPTNPAQITLTSNVAHNHACGCSKCWKPAGALFSVVGVVPSSSLSITANESKLAIVDPSAPIQRYACTDCGVHLFGRIEIEHPFKGLDFVHVELSEGKGREGWQKVQFAGFVSSLIGQGLEPELVPGVRGQLKGLGLESYDALSPVLMDLIATWNAKREGVVFKSRF
ncbi:putative glutathione-dependent formaldehyde-activating enzyme [Aspergillus karnatakaensis]|uniref:putative glutathione-dependent formaldehyde-activating enzyme n=1 Tax=Aspergillus karnatakaensis TaxID=1810916 RepID=UPI003CCD4D05